MRHAVAFAASKEGAENALRLFCIIKGWKTAEVFVDRGKVTEFIRVSETLECFANSFSKPDAKDHCLLPVKVLPTMEECGQFLGEISAAIVNLEKKAEPKLKKHGVNILPCKLLHGFALTGREGTDPENADQLVPRMATIRSCDWCPNFNLKNYVRIYNEAEPREEKKIKPQLGFFARLIGTKK